MPYFAKSIYFRSWSKLLRIIRTEYFSYQNIDSRTFLIKKFTAILWWIQNRKGEGERKEKKFVTRKRKKESEVERKNVDSIYRTQVEMVAHKYSYGIPKARKTSIPAEAHVCRSPPPFSATRGAFGNFADGQWENADQLWGKIPELRLFCRVNLNFLCECLTRSQLVW